MSRDGPGDRGCGDREERTLLGHAVNDEVEGHRCSDDGVVGPTGQVPEPNPGRKVGGQLLDDVVRLCHHVGVGLSLAGMNRGVDLHDAGRIVGCTSRIGRRDRCARAARDRQRVSAGGVPDRVRVDLGDAVVERRRGRHSANGLLGHEELLAGVQGEWRRLHDIGEPGLGVGVAVAAQGPAVVKLSQLASGRRPDSVRSTANSPNVPLFAVAPAGTKLVLPNAASYTSVAPGCQALPSHV